MTLTTQAPPPGFAEASELPARTFEDEAGWTENYCYVAYDPASEIGIWSHLGRATFEPTLWRELSILYLPTGERLMTKGYGRAETERGPGGASLSYTCEEPWNRWTTRLDGAAVRATEAQLDGAVMGDAVHEPVAYELDWRAAGPVLELGEAMQGQSWGNVHYEQLCGVRGTVRHSGTEVAFDGVGIRDHTRGPRDFGAVLRHVWANAVFPSGRGFILIDVEVEGHRLSRAVLLEDGVLRAAEVRGAPFLTSHADGSASYEMQLGDARITAEILHNMPYGFAGCNDVVLGYDPAVVTHSLFEGFTRFTWDGETGHGLTERTLRER